MIYALLCSDPGGLVARHEVRATLDEALAEAAASVRPLAETWGTSPQAIANRLAAEAQFGPAR